MGSRESTSGTPSLCWSWKPRPGLAGRPTLSDGCTAGLACRTERLRRGHALVRGWRLVPAGREWTPAPEKAQPPSYAWFGVRRARWASVGCTAFPPFRPPGRSGPRELPLPSAVTVSPGEGFGPTTQRDNGVCHQILRNLRPLGTGGLGRCRPVPEPCTALCDAVTGHPGARRPRDSI